MADDYPNMLRRLYSAGHLSAEEMAKAIADYNNAKWARRSAIASAIVGAISAAASATAAFLSYQALIANQRAYISYEGVNSRKDEIPSFRYSINPKITNSGNTPTRDLRIKVNCWLDPEAEPGPFDKFHSQNLSKYRVTKWLLWSESYTASD